MPYWEVVEPTSRSCWTHNLLYWPPQDLKCPSKATSGQSGSFFYKLQVTSKGHSRAQSPTVCYGPSVSRKRLLEPPNKAPECYREQHVRPGSHGPTTHRLANQFGKLWSIAKESSSRQGFRQGSLISQRSPVKAAQG